MDWAPLFLSLKLATVSMVLALVCGTSLAVLFSWRRLPGRELLYTLAIAPMVLPPTVLGYYVLVVLGRNSVIGKAWEALFGTPIVFSFTGAVIAASIGSLPLVVRAARIGLESVDLDLKNAARTLGARPLRVLFTVVLPLAAPAIFAGAMLAFARALGDYGLTQMVAGQRVDGVETGAIHVANAMFSGHEEAARNMSIAMTMVGFVLLYAANYVLNRFARHVHV